jgi:hypothetical protein
MLSQLIEAVLALEEVSPIGSINSGLLCCISHVWSISDPEIWLPLFEKLRASVLAVQGFQSVRSRP